MPEYPDILTILDREYDLDEKFERSLPICDRCGCHIKSEFTLHPEGTDLLFCEDCIPEMMVLTENYVG